MIRKHYLMQSITKIVKNINDTFLFQNSHFKKSVKKVLTPIPLLPISMLCGGVTAFGWKVLVIQVACTSDTKLTWGKGALKLVYIVLFQLF